MGKTENDFCELSTTTKRHIGPQIWRTKNAYRVRLLYCPPPRTQTTLTRLKTF